MKRAGWNPVRRNRKIGTEDSGYSQDNRLVIPERTELIDQYKSFYEDLNNPVCLSIDFPGHSILLLVEPTNKGFAHACTPADITAILHLLPYEHIRLIQTIVLRQPKKKEEVLNPVWGRMIYWGDYLDRYGPTIILEAQALPSYIKWSNSLTPFDKKELEASENDGHKITLGKRNITISGSLGSVRNTQLYRTVPHEVGHLVDYAGSYLNQLEGRTEVEKERLSALYFSKPSLDKEEFANRYARELMEKAANAGQVPFARIFEPEKLKLNGLKLAWFSQ